MSLYKLLLRHFHLRENRLFDGFGLPLDGCVNFIESLALDVGSRPLCVKSEHPCRHICKTEFRVGKRYSSVRAFVPACKNKTGFGGRGRSRDRRTCICFNGLYRAAALAVKGYRIFFFGDKFIKLLGLFSAADRTGVNHSAFFFRGRLNSYIAAVPGVLGFVFGFLTALICARVPMMRLVVAPFFRKVVFPVLVASGKNRKRQNKHQRYCPNSEQ